MSVRLSPLMKTLIIMKDRNIGKMMMPAKELASLAVEVKVPMRIFETVKRKYPAIRMTPYLAMLAQLIAAEMSSGSRPLLFAMITSAATGRTSADICTMPIIIKEMTLPAMR